MSVPAWQAIQRQLPALLAGLADDVPALPVSGIATDSRRVRPGELFLALPGGRSHGLDFVGEALARGAAAIGWDQGTPPPAGVPALRVPGLAAKVGVIAARYYGEPARRLQVTGITGTDGKTSCAHILAQGLARLARRCGYLGTLGYGELPELAPAAHTTPDAVALHEWLARLAAAGCDAVALEVSSHALAQHRVDGVAFATAVLTNVGRDHLDYHGTAAAYAGAKRRLFEMSGLQTAVLNADDPRGARWLQDLPAGVTPVAYGLRQTPAQARGGYVFAREVLAQPHGLVVDIESSWGRLRLESPLLGRFNAYNLLAALAVLLADGVPAAAAVRALAQATTVPGRMDVVAAPPCHPLVVVDYAHTPGALEQALRAVCEHSGGRVHCVFGCGGERDPGKRPLMGAMAARYADAIWITDDNPRSEDPRAIVAAIAAGLPDSAPVTVEHDRAAAIASAIAAAGPADAVLIAGKGHETTQQVGEERRRFDDRDVARRCLEAA